MNIVRDCLRLVFYCSAPIEGGVGGYLCIKMQTRMEARVVERNSTTYNLNISPLASISAEFSETTSVGNTNPKPVPMSIKPVMMEVASGRCVVRMVYICSEEPIGCNLCWSVCNERLPQGDQHRAEHHQVKPMVNLRETECPGRIEHRSHDKGNPESPGIGDVVGWEVHERVDQKGHNHGKAHLDFGNLVHLGQLMGNRNY
jgi:hypothetical protein